jgi:hypothetical protein
MPATGTIIPSSLDVNAVSTETSEARSTNGRVLMPTYRVPDYWQSWTISVVSSLIYLMQNMRRNEGLLSRWSRALSRSTEEERSEYRHSRRATGLPSLAQRLTLITPVRPSCAVFHMDRSTFYVYTPERRERLFDPVRTWLP